MVDLSKQPAQDPSGRSRLRSQTQTVSLRKWLGPPPNAGPAHDLAMHQPGTLRLEQAREIRSTAPIKTRAERLLLVSRSAEARARATAGAERKVATLLDRLDRNWHVLHSVPVGGGRPEVSHLVIGQAGVFTIASRVFKSAYRSRPSLIKDKVEAQVFEDRIRIHGETMPWIAEARAQAWRTARALSAASGMTVFVRPAVVVLGVDDVRIYKPADRVNVLPRHLLLKWLEQFPATLHPDAVARIYSAARHANTWADPANAFAANDTAVLDRDGGGEDADAGDDFEDDADGR